MELEIPLGASGSARGKGIHLGVPLALLGASAKQGRLSTARLILFENQSLRSGPTGVEDRSEAYPMGFDTPMDRRLLRAAKTRPPVST